MQRRFSETEPYDSGTLDVGDGHRVYWECCGNRDGKPAVFLHGGPGSGFTSGASRYFDPDVYRILLFDQRGSGRSRPLASDQDADLSTNTTAHLIADMECLRRYHEIEQWTVLGISWGTTLGLAYAQTHPERVRSLVLALVTTTSRREVQWITGDVGRVFPKEWERFSLAVPDTMRHRPLVDAYSTLLFDPDPAVREDAALEWCAWEDVHVSLSPGHKPNPRFEDREFRLCFARLVTHYWRHAGFLADNQLLNDASLLNGIPGILIHGRYDVSSPLETAWHLSKSWSTSRLLVLGDVGHRRGEALVAAVTNALNQLAAK